MEISDGSVGLRKVLLGTWTLRVLVLVVCPFSSGAGGIGGH